MAYRALALTTVVISDLHLGLRTAADVLRRPAALNVLQRRLEGVERLVLLGDVLELRHGPLRDALEIAEPVLRALAAALGGGRVVLVPGNHDHAVVAPWLERRANQRPAAPLGLEHTIAPGAASETAAALAAALAPADVEVAYPGLWLRDDVYAIHGHYSDVHSTVPTFERLATGAMARWVVSLPQAGATPDDYEAVLSPLYAWMHALTQRSDHATLSAGAGASARAWVELAGSGRRRRPLRAAAFGAGYVAGVAALNALGVGPIERSLSGAALRRGSLHGMREVLRRLGVSAPYVVWGHSHRSGPWPRDDRAEWTTPAGTRILNAGSWVYQPHFLTERPNGSPYWPGTAIELDDEGPPRLVRLLGERGHDALKPRVRPAAVRSPA